MLNSHCSNSKIRLTAANTPFFKVGFQYTSQIDLSIGLLTSGVVNILHHLVDNTIHSGQRAFGKNQSFSAGFFIKWSNHRNGLSRW